MKGVPGIQSQKAGMTVEGKMGSENYFVDGSWWKL